MNRRGFLGALLGGAAAVVVAGAPVLEAPVPVAVRLVGRLSERRVAFSEVAEARAMLKAWLAESIDRDLFEAMA